MAIRIVRLGTPRTPGEGLRIGTVRRPPRGVPKGRYADDDWYDVWYPELSPSADRVGAAKGVKSDAEWAAWSKLYRRQMAEPAAARTIALLAALSRDSHFSVGCYCQDETHCHRSILRELLVENGADIASG